MLLVASLADAERVLCRNRLRWRIEDWHRILPSGCHRESWSSASPGRSRSRPGSLAASRRWPTRKARHSLLPPGQGASRATSRPSPGWTRSSILSEAYPLRATCHRLTPGVLTSLLGQRQRAAAPAIKHESTTMCWGLAPSTRLRRWPPTGTHPSLERRGRGVCPSPCHPLPTPDLPLAAQSCYPTGVLSRPSAATAHLTVHQTVG